MATRLLRHRFTARDFHRMAEVGIISESDRVELLDGEIVEMTPISSRHASCVKRLNRLFSRSTGLRALVGIQDPVELSDHSEPQPDVVLLRPRDDDYSKSHPGPADVLLLVEVADTSLEYDRDVKIPAYARAGIPEVWLVDLAHARIEVYLQPSGVGYGKTVSAGPGESLTPSLLPGIAVKVDEVLG